MFIWDFVANPIMDALMDWFLQSVSWAFSAHFLPRWQYGRGTFLNWNGYKLLSYSSPNSVGLCMASVWSFSGFECGIEYISGRGNIQQAALNAIKGFLAVNLFTVVPVRLYSLSVALQGTFAQGITGAGSGIGDLGAAILENMESTSLTEVAAAGTGELVPTHSC